MKLKYSINQEMANYIQKFIFEIDNKIFIIDRLFSTHKDDNDDSLLKSEVFNKHMNEYIKLRVQYVELTQLINNQILDFLRERNYKFNTVKWNIEDFHNDRDLIIELN